MVDFEKVKELLLQSEEIFREVFESKNDKAFLNKYVVKLKEQLDSKKYDDDSLFKGFDYFDFVKASPEKTGDWLQLGSKFSKIKMQVNAVFCYF